MRGRIQSESLVLHQGEQLPGPVGPEGCASASLCQLLQRRAATHGRQPAHQRRRAISVQQSHAVALPEERSEGRLHVAVHSQYGGLQAGHTYRGVRVSSATNELAEVTNNESIFPFVVTRARAVSSWTVSPTTMRPSASSVMWCDSW